jgi:hypothetical protein
LFRLKHNLGVSQNPLKNRILVQDSVFASRLRRDKRGPNPAEKGGRPKDIFAMDYSVSQSYGIMFFMSKQSGCFSAALRTCYIALIGLICSIGSV